MFQYRTIRLSKRYRQRAFTLIELSIVLVIIGLVLGGVLVGRDLIEAAQVRSQASQFTRFNTSLYTFKLKYDALPGDVSNKFGIATKSGDGAAGYNNGKLNDNSGNYPAQNLNSEISSYFTDLRTVGLLNEEFQTPFDSYWRVFPKTKMGADNIGLIPYQRSDGKIVYFMGMNSAGSCCPTFIFMNDTASGKYSTTPQQSYALDTKMDDGLPLTGKVQAGDISATAFIQDTTNSQCITSTASNTYNVSNTLRQCRLNVESD